MTVYKAVKPEAQDAARMAVALAKGNPLPANLINLHTNNGQTSVPSVILTPVAVTTANVTCTVVKDGYWTPAQICTPAFASACKSAGITLASDARPLLALKGVTKRFGAVQALDGVDFEVHAGEVVGLVGDNGAGKSTLVKIISGIYSPDEGESHATACRSDPRPVGATQLGIATVYQDLALADNLDVVANLFLGSEEFSSGPGRVTWQLDETDMEHRSHDLLEQFAVTIPSVRSEVATLSGGQRQQVAVARSLLGEPKIVLLDEPTAALGVAQTAQVLALIKRLRERGLGVMVISHNLADVFEVADRIVVLRLGRPAGTFEVTGRPRTRSWPRSRAHAGTRRKGSVMSAHPGRDPRPRAAHAPLAAGSARRVVQGDHVSVRVIVAIAVIWIIFQLRTTGSSPRSTSPTSCCRSPPPA